MKKLIEIEQDLIKLEEKIMEKIDKYGWDNNDISVDLKEIYSDLTTAVFHLQGGTLIIKTEE